MAKKECLPGKMYCVNGVCVDRDCLFVEHEDCPNCEHKRIDSSLKSIDISSKSNEILLSNEYDYKEFNTQESMTFENSVEHSK